MSKKSDEEESVDEELTANDTKDLYLGYSEERQGLKAEKRVQEIYNSYVDQFVLLQHAISRALEDDSFKPFVSRYGNELDSLEERRRRFLNAYAQDIEPDEETEAAYDERQRLAKEAEKLKKVAAKSTAVVEDSSHVAIDIPDSVRRVPPSVVVRRGDAANVIASHRDVDERTMYFAQSEVTPRVMGGARTTTASSRSSAESVGGEEDGAERLSARALSARSVRDERKLPGAKTARSSAAERVSEWMSQVDGSHHDDPSEHRSPRQVGKDDDLESLYDRSMSEHRHSDVEAIYGEIRVFSVPGGKKGYLDNVMEEHFTEVPKQHLKLSQSDYMNFVGAVDQRIAEDLQKGVLKSIEPEPVTLKISKYNIKGHTLKEIENDNGIIDFEPDPGLSGVVRVQRRDKSGALIEAYDTIEYQEGKVSRLIVGGEGISRLGDIGLPKERGVLVAGEMSPEEQAKFASMSVSKEREEARRAVPAGIPRLDFSKLKLPHIDGDVVPSARVSPAPTPKGAPVRVLRTGGHTSGRR